MGWLSWQPRTPKTFILIFFWQAEGKYKDDPVDLRLDIERRKKHKERDLKRGKSRESVDSRDSSHSRERSAEKTEKTHKGSKKQKYVSPSPHSDSWAESHLPPLGSSPNLLKWVWTFSKEGLPWEMASSLGCGSVGNHLGFKSSWGGYVLEMAQNHYQVTTLVKTVWN